MYFNSIGFIVFLYVISALFLFSSKILQFIDFQLYNMQRFFKSFLLFLSIPFFLIFIAELSIYIFKDKIYNDDNLEIIFNNEIIKYNWVNTIVSNNIVVLAGSSSVRYGLSCGILNKLSNNQRNFVNLAMDARDPIVTYFIIKNMDLKKVSAIYFGLDPWIYSKAYYRHRSSYMYLDFDFLEILRFSMEYQKKAFFLRYKNLVSILFLNNINKANNLELKVPEDYGSVALNIKPLNFNEPINTWFQIDKYGWSDLQFVYLKKIMDLCSSKNIKFSVFIPPKRSDYSYIYQNQCKSIHNEYLLKFIEFKINPPIFGSFNQLESMGNSIYFAEAYHLNTKGQKTYSELFYKMIESENKLLTGKYNWFSKKE